MRNHCENLFTAVQTVLLQQKF